MQALWNVIDRIEKIRNDKEDLTAIKCDINILNRILNGGFSKGNLYVIAGRESVGKTSFVISLISDIIRKTNSHRAGIISLNISEERWIERMISNITEVWLEKITRGRLEEHERQKVYDNSRFKELEKIEIVTPGYLNIQELIDTCNTWVSQKDVEIIFIDYLQLISIENMQGKQLKIFTISQALKQLSIDLDVPIIVTVPLKPGKAVSDLKDLRPIGAIEPLADVIMFLNKEVFNNDQKNKQENKGEIYISILKNNSGQLDTIKLRALLYIQKFIEFDY